MIIENKEIIVYYQGIAAILMLIGNPLKDLRTNKNNTSLDVFVFKDSIKIQEDMIYAKNKYFELKNKDIKKIL